MREGNRRRLLGCAALAVLAMCFVEGAPSQAQPFVYVANQAGSVSQYDAAGGALSPLAPASVASAGETQGLAVSADGKSVYVANPFGNTVSQYDIGPGGTLSPKTPPTVGAGDLPVGIAVSPDGKSVYVTNAIFCSGTVSQFDVGPGGALTPKSPPTVTAGCHPTGVAVSPGSDSVYVTNSVFSTAGVAQASISQYDAGAGGALTAKSPASVTTPSNPLGIAVSQDGRSVYVADVGDAPNQLGDVLQFDVGPDGVLAFKAPSSVPADNTPDGIVISPDGNSVYVTNNFVFGGGLVSQYDVGAGGALSPKTPATVVTGNRPSGVAVSPDGKSVYVANAVDDNVSQYDVDPVTGALSPKIPATVAAGGGPQAIAVSPLPTLPTDKAQCKNGGWKTFGVFKNQGDCVNFVAAGGKNPPSGP